MPKFSANIIFGKSNIAPFFISNDGSLSPQTSTTRKNLQPPGFRITQGTLCPLTSPPWDLDCSRRLGFHHLGLWGARQLHC